MMTARSYLVSRQAQRPATVQQPQQSRPLPHSPLSTPPFKSEDDQFENNKHTVPVVSVVPVPAITMPLRRREQPQSLEAGALSPPRTTTTVTITRPTTSAAPVQIPMRPRSRDLAHPQKSHRHGGERRHHSTAQRSKDLHSPDAIPPSVAALLAITSIPPSRQTRSGRQTRMEKRMTVESIIERAQESEKEFSLTLSKSPLDILLMAPEDLESDDMSLCESTMGSVLSTRTVSLESMPSLCNSYATDTLSSLGMPHTPARRKSVRPTRRSLTPVSSPPGSESAEDHPLSSQAPNIEQLDFRVFEDKEVASEKKDSPFKPLKSAFKSNLTASLRALRQAARSFSNLNFPSIPPEDFLTRSILTIDPQVPYTDERRPPQLEEEPTAALRRYLNPTTSVRIEKPEPTVTSSPALRTFTASIQMQTYKVHRSRSAPPHGRSPYPSVGPSAVAQTPQSKQPVAEYPMPGPRQREMRENPDFIRIAVMEMAMRKRGKLDDQRPGRARWALPPRKPNTKPYEIGADGVPARWASVSY
ncbi:hypothetical protein QBC43DRAFT_62167 [Cladorrhinum sp. PSN259]|nr:hypothetical protein QBC43DRAFT_62167 [Cladorrhinum sp. PSN259]